MSPYSPPWISPCFDGHEQHDVVQERNKFIKTMAEIGFVHPDQAPTPEAANAFPKDVALPSTDQRNKTVIFFHDESTFNSNEDQRTQWGKKGEHVLKPKSKGSGIMVSDFVEGNLLIIKAMLLETYWRSR